MKNILIVILLVNSFSALSQITFQKTYDAPSLNRAEFVMQTADGGYLFSGTGDHPDRLCVVKTDAYGNKTWSKILTAVSNGTVQGFSVTETFDGGYVVSGCYNAFGTMSAPALVKLDANGDLTWMKCYNTWNSGAAGLPVSIVQAPDSGYLLMSNGPSFGLTNFMDICVIKTDPSGNVQWSNTYGGYSDELGFTLLNAQPSGYVIYGYSVSFDYFSRVLIRLNENGTVAWTKAIGSGGFWKPGSFIEQTSDYGYVLFSSDDYNGISKVDSSGDLVWTRNFSVANDVLNLSSLDQTSDGGYVLSGSLQNTTSTHACLIRLDPNGDVLWNRLFEDLVSANTDVFDLVQTSDGGFAMTGWHAGQTGFSMCLLKTDANGDNSCAATIITGLNYNTISAADSGVVISYDPGVPPEFSIPCVVDTAMTESSFCFDVGIQGAVNQNTFGEVLIFPNPFHSVAKFSISLHLQVAGKSFELRIFNSIGVLVRTEKILNLKSYLLHRDGLRDGLYFFELLPDACMESDIFVWRGKFVIE